LRRTRKIRRKLDGGRGRTHASLQWRRASISVARSASHPNAKSKPDPGGPLILYYHATGGQSSEVHRGFGDQNIAAVTAAGGVVASFTTTACPSACTTTDDFVWWVEDADVQDTVVACAIQQAKIDTRRIHALGWSAGALHSAWVGLARSNYMASIISYSPAVTRSTRASRPFRSSSSSIIRTRCRPSLTPLASRRASPRIARTRREF
jgi:predicted esterase